MDITALRKLEDRSHIHLRLDLTATKAADLMQNANLGQQRGILIQSWFFSCE